MDGRSTLSGQTVVIEDGRISRMGRVGDIPTAGMDVVDGTGRYLMPGLTDMHAAPFTVSASAAGLLRRLLDVRTARRHIGVATTQSIRIPIRVHVRLGDFDRVQTTISSRSEATTAQMLWRSGTA